MFHHVYGIHDRDHGIKSCELRKRLVISLFAFFIRVAVPCFLVLLVSKIYFTHGESLSDRKWLRDAGGLDNEVIVVSPPR